MDSQIKRFTQDESDSSEEDQDIDHDTCSISELENQFSKYFILTEESVSLRKVYLLHLDSTRSYNKVVAGASNGMVHVFDINTANLNKSAEFDSTLCGTTTSVCGVKFLEDSESVVLAANTNGCINLYDLRTNQKEHTFEDSEEGVRKPITCLDVNANSRLICAGTEQIERDAFLLFFDIRQRALLGGYWESHQDDITSVKFHPTNPDCLSTGSTDGLINIFDLSESTEDDALKNVINNECSVQKLNWLKNAYDKDILSCVTDTNDLRVYDTEGDVMSQFSRSDIANAVKRKSADHSVLVNCHNLRDGSIFLLAGTNFHKGEILRSAKICNKKLVVHGNFDGNKQIIRDSLYNSQSDLLITAGESSIITLWSQEELKKPLTSNKLKGKSGSQRIHKQKPY